MTISVSCAINRHEKDAHNYLINATWWWDRPTAVAEASSCSWIELNCPAGLSSLSSVSLPLASRSWLLSPHTTVIRDVMASLLTHFAMKQAVLVLNDVNEMKKCRETISFSYKFSVSLVFFVHFTSSSFCLFYTPFFFLVDASSHRPIHFACELCCKVLQFAIFLVGHETNKTAKRKKKTMRIMCVHIEEVVLCTK